jgi:SAM-dependent methyltransferase
MGGSMSGRLQIWNGWTPTMTADTLEPATSDGRPPADLADAWFARETLRPLSSRDRPRPEPYSLAWFEEAEQRRHGRHGAWMPRLLEFARHPDETVLCLGDGLGTDWVQYARHGASVTACAASPDQLAAVRRNFEVRGLAAQFVQAPPDRLPLPAESVDVVNLNSLWTAWTDPAALAAELYRVLRPGGKVIALAPSHYNAWFWSAVFFPWQRWTVRHPELPPAAWTGRQLRRAFGQFTEHRVHKRQLRRSELPHVWRLLPLSVLERLMGRVLVLKAFKPLSAALPVRVAA